MSVSQLDEIILAADSEKCAAFFENMPESQRKTYASRALQWVSAINGFMCGHLKIFMSVDRVMARDITFFDSIQAGEVDFPREFYPSSFPAAQISALAACSFADLKKAGWPVVPEADIVIRVLKNRKPDWLSKWCAYVTKEFPVTLWFTIYEFEKSGLCEVDQDANYWLSMFCSVSFIENMYEEIIASDEKIQTRLLEMLKEPSVIRLLLDPERVSDELLQKGLSGGRHPFHRKQLFSRKGSDLWHQTIVRLACDGLIDRTRLIDYSFGLLFTVAEQEHKKSYFPPASEFAIKLHQELVHEHKNSYISQYTSLLSSTNKDISAYVSAVLNAMPPGSLRTAEICACIEPAFLSKSKEPADGALKLLSRLVKEEPLKVDEYGKAILAAFNHPSKDIHRKALALVESTKLLKDKSLLGEFCGRIDMLAGLERSQAEKLAASYQTVEAPTKLTNKASATLTSADELFARASRLDKKLSAVARIDDTINGIKANQFVDIPVSLNTLDYPRLDPESVLKPIDKLDDLIYMFTKVWSDNYDAMELELVLDGVSRLCDQRPPDFEAKTESLRQKANKLTQSVFPSRFVNGFNRVANAWLGAARPYAVTRQADCFFSRRCLTLAQRAGLQNPAPLLAAPTHRGGWIDPVIFVKRLLEYRRTNLEPDAADFIQALLRLAPENRGEALRAAGVLNNEMGEVVRYSLGGAAPAEMPTHAFWVAAYRAREPLGTNEHLLNLIPNAGPDAAVPATYDFDLATVKLFADDSHNPAVRTLPNFLPVRSLDPHFPEIYKESFYLDWEEFCASFRNRYRYELYPTVLLHDIGTRWTTENESYTWLHNRESLLAFYAKRMLRNINSIGSFWSGDFEFLFDPDVSMCGHGRYFLCLAMSSKNADLARFAVDILIAAIGERRIASKDLGAAMALFLKTGVISPIRWIKGLRDVGRTTLLHAYFTWQSIGTLLERGELKSTQQIPFLELLLELQLEHKFQLDKTLEQALSEVRGGGKCQKLIKTLLSAPVIENSWFPAAVQDLESKIERVERWQRWLRVQEAESIVEIAADLQTSDTT